MLAGFVSTPLQGALFRYVIMAWEQTHQHTIQILRSDQGSVLEITRFSRPELTGLEFRMLSAVKRAVSSSQALDDFFVSQQLALNIDFSW